MPKRPRQHQLESESRAAIRAAIPSVWVYRDLEQDYGVDSEIEIFDEAGVATGAKFLVQLKATDEPNLQKALRLWFPQSKGGYYASLDLPVLIVRFHAPSQRLFARWFHSFDPYYGKRSKVGISFTLTEENAWDILTPERLTAEVEAYRQLKSPQMARPLHFSLFIAGQNVHGIPAHQLRLRLYQNMGKIPYLATIQTDAPASGATTHVISVTEKEIEIKVGGIQGFTLHTPHGWAEKNPDTFLQHDIMLGIGLALDWHGHSIEAAQIISQFWRESRLARDVSTAFPIAICLARANQMHAALDIAESLCQDEPSVDAAQIYLLPFFSRQVGRSDTERDFAIRVISRIADSLEQRGGRVQAAMLNYNCANLLREMCRLQEAIRFYRKAARLDAAYLKKSYYWGELAGVLFAGRRYALAASFYKRSLDIEDHRHTQALYADALMFAGHYAMAEEIFDQILETPVLPEDAEWALKGFALDLLRRLTGLDTQRRKTPDFPAAFDTKETKDPEVERMCRKALQEDALSGLAWFNLGVIRHRAKDSETAARCFLLAALIVPWDFEAWHNVLALAIGSGNSDLLGLAVASAYMANGERFLGWIADRMKKNKDEEIALIANVLQEFSNRNQPPDLKMHHPSAAWDYFRITSD